MYSLRLLRRRLPGVCDKGGVTSFKEEKHMTEILDLRKVVLELNSPLWQISELEGEQVLQVTGNMSTTEKTGMAAYLDEDHVGRVALIGDIKGNYRMQAEMRFLRYYRDRGGWFGFAIRAKDSQNYELVWFMPNAEPGRTAAYVAVAHGIVPWWTEAYANQKKAPHIFPLMPGSEHV